MKVWVFYGTTKAGDYYGPAVFDYPVTKAEIGAMLNEVAPGVEVEIKIWAEQVNSRAASRSQAQFTRLRSR